MRIGIFTQPLLYNYGGILQNYALQEVLRKLGNDVATLSPDVYEHLDWNKKPFIYLLRIMKILLGRKISINEEEKANRIIEFRMRNLRPFISRHIKERPFKLIKEVAPTEFDMFVVGSDQVWRPKYNCWYGLRIEDSFLDFAEGWNVRRISYAASFGTEEWEYSEAQRIRCSSLLHLFNAVSVRETQAIGMCKSYLGVDAIQTLDPTLLLTKEDYERIINEETYLRKPAGGLLCYFLDYDNEKRELVSKISENIGLEPFNAFVGNNILEESCKEERYVSIAQWLSFFKEAEFVVTDSFHACVFSVIFQKPFIAICNKERGASRFKSLLEPLSLGDHLLDSAGEYNYNNSYRVKNEVLDMLYDLRKKSLEFLVKTTNCYQ